MKNQTKIFGIYLPIFALVTLAAVSMRTIACLEHFNHYTNYFENKALITASDIIIVAAAVFMFSYIFTAKKDMKLIPSFSSAATFVPTGLVIAALAFMAIYMYRRAENLRDVINSISHADQTITINMVIAYVCAAFAVLGALHFVLAALLEKISSNARANFGLCSVAFFAVYAIYLYFDTGLPLNAPNKLLDEMVYLFAALFFLFETRLSLGREKWKEYIAFGFIAAMLSAYSSIPALITYFVDGYSISNNAYESILTLAIFIFITARIILTGELIEDKESNIVCALSIFATKRNETVIANTEEARIKEEERRAEEELRLKNEPAPIDENQITIEEMFVESEEQTAEDTYEETSVIEEENNIVTEEDNIIAEENDTETEEQEDTDEKNSGN